MLVDKVNKLQHAVNFNLAIFIQIKEKKYHAGRLASYTKPTSAARIRSSASPPTARTVYTKIRFHSDRLEEM